MKIQGFAYWLLILVGISRSTSDTYDGKFFSTFQTQIFGHRSLGDHENGAHHYQISRLFSTFQTFVRKLLVDICMW